MKGSTYWGLVLFVGILVISLSYSTNIAFGLSQFEKLVPFLFIILIGFFSNNEKGISIQSVGKYYSLGVGLLLLISVLGVIYQLIFGHLIGNLTIYGIGQLDFFHTIGHRTYVGIAVLMAFPYWYTVMEIRTKKINKVTSISFLFIASVFILFSGARAVMLSTLVIHFVFISLILKRRVKPIVFYTFIFVVLVGNIAILTFTPRFQRIITLSLQGGGVYADPRIRIWSAAIDQIKQAWMFGYGLGDAKDQLLDQYKQSGFSLGYTNQYNAHNQYLETWLGGGVLAVGTLVLMLVSLFKFKGEKHIYAITLFIVFGINLFFESLFVRNMGTLQFAFWFLVLQTSSNIRESKQISKINKLELKLAGVVLLGFISVFLFARTLKFDSNNPQSYLQVPYTQETEEKGDSIPHSFEKIDLKNLDYILIREGAFATIPFHVLKNGNSGLKSFYLWVKLPKDSKISSARLFIDELGEETIWDEYVHYGKWELLQIKNVELEKNATFGLRIDYFNIDKKDLPHVSDIIYITSPQIKNSLRNE